MVRHRRASGAAYTDVDFRDSPSRTTVVIPTVEEATAIGRTVAAGVRLRERGVLADVVVVDGGSTDGTPDVARAAGARVVNAADVCPRFGPVLGKGDAIWRSLAVVETDVVAFVDADLEGDLDAFIRGLVGPVAATDADPAVSFVKGSFHRIAPDGAEETDPFDGGRVTELVARPLLNLFRPDLAEFYQPLSGQVAGRTAGLLELPVLTGYAVEIGMLIEAIDRFGPDAVVEVALGSVRNRPRPTADLAPMAQEVLWGFLSRVLGPDTQPAWREYWRPRADGSDDRLGTTVVERPPMATVLAAGA